MRPRAGEPRPDPATRSPDSDGVPVRLDSPPRAIGAAHKRAAEWRGADQADLERRPRRRQPRRGRAARPPVAGRGSQEPDDRRVIRTAVAASTIKQATRRQYASGTPRWKTWLHPGPAVPSRSTCQRPRPDRLRAGRATRGAAATFVRREALAARLVVWARDTGGGPIRSGRSGSSGRRPSGGATLTELSWPPTGQEAVLWEAIEELAGTPIAQSGSLANSAAA